MRGVAKIFTSGHSKGGGGGFDRTPRTPLATGMIKCIQFNHIQNRMFALQPLQLEKE